MVGRDRRARQPSSCLSTSLYKNSSALSAWFLCGSGHSAIPRQMREKSGHFRFRHLRWVAFAVKQNQTPDPVQI